MISESKYWKDPLLKTAAWIEKPRKKVIDRKYMVKFEQEILIGFYAIRKILDAFKVSTKISKKKFHLESFNSKPGAIIDHMNWHRIEEHYDLDNKKNELKDIRFVCNQIIHSYVFCPWISDDGTKVEEILIASDYERHKKLYKYPISLVTSIFQEVGNNYPKNEIRTRNPSTKQWEIISF